MGRTTVIDLRRHTPLAETPWKTAAPRDYGTGRHCPICGTQLSRYNPGAGCYAHEDAPLCRWSFCESTSVKHARAIVARFWGTQAACATELGINAKALACWLMKGLRSSGPVSVERRARLNELIAERLKGGE